MTLLMILHLAVQEAAPDDAPEYARQILGLESSYYLGWGTLCLLNAGIAQGKNRSGFNWFLLSVFLGPLATFLLLLCDKLPAPDNG